MDVVKSPVLSPLVDEMLKGSDNVGDTVGMDDVEDEFVNGKDVDVL